MKKLLTSIISFILLFTLIVPVGAQLGLPDAGITPDSPFYFLDRWGEGIGMAFSFSAKAKTNKALNYSEEKLAEVKAMVEQKKAKQTEKANNRYQHFLEVAEKKSEKVKDKKRNLEEVKERVARATSKHLTVLEEVSSKVPQESKEAIEKAKEKSKQGHINALKDLSNKNPEAAIKVGSDALEERLENANNAAKQGQPQKVEAAVQNFNDLQENFKELQGEEINLVSLASKEKINQMKVLNEMSSSTRKMPEEVRNKVDELGKEVEESFQKGLKRVVQKNPQDAAEINAEAAEKQLNGIRERAQRLEEKSEQCKNNCVNNCENQDLEACKSKCLSYAGCDAQEDCPGELTQKCEAACNADDRDNCIGNCFSACIYHQEQSMEKQVNDLKQRSEFGKEISSIAQQIGKDEAKVQELVSKANSRHIEILKKVRKKVPQEAHEGIDSAISSSEGTREKAMNALRQASQKGETEAREALDRINEKAGTSTPNAKKGETENQDDQPNEEIQTPQQGESGPGKKESDQPGKSQQ